MWSLLSIVVHTFLFIALVVFIAWIIVKLGSRKEDSRVPFSGKTKKKKKNSICGTDYNSDNISLPAMTDPSHVVNYIITCGTVPPFYIKKADAKKAGWVTMKKKNNLQVVLPKRAIGDDIYENRDGRLPGGKYLEYDVNYNGNVRGQHRLAVRENCVAKSNIQNCNIYLTKDHYKTFAKLI